MSEQRWGEFRVLLKDLLHDPTVRKLIEQRTDISSRTLARWVSGETEEPDRKRLTTLLQALPHYREALLAVIMRAIPDFTIPLIDNTNNLLEELPITFWIRLLETNATVPRNLHFASIVNMAFLQLQPYIDPEHIGIQLIVAQCSPPVSPDQPVRSLREVMKQTTHLSSFERPGDKIFLGAESLSGYTVSTCQANIVQNVQRERLLPVRRMEHVQSAAAYPIQQGGYVAGCFIVASPQPDYFLPRLQSLLQVYANFLVLAFETQLFYDSRQLRLRPMPAESVQQSYIKRFQERVMLLLHSNPSLGRLQAEELIWQQIEEELVALPPDLS